MTDDNSSKLSSEKYYREFSVLDWAFTLITALYVVALFIAYFLTKNNWDKLYVDLEMDLPSLTKGAGLLLPIMAVVAGVALILVLNPGSRLKIRNRRYGILGIFLLSMASMSFYSYAIMMPIKKINQMFGDNPDKHESSHQKANDCDEDVPTDLKGMTRSQSTTTKVELSRLKKQKAINDLSAVIQQARMTPSFRCGKVNGFKIFAIEPGSIFEALGLKNGDVVMKVNETAIDSAEKAVPILEVVKLADSFTIEILRTETKSQTLSIETR